MPEDGRGLKVTASAARTRLAAMVGTTVEYYDFFVYSIAAVWVFPMLFFPTGNPTTALLASLATFGLAFVARPVGSMLFGHFGDRIGRKSTLVATMAIMGVGTFLIGLLPSYQQIGVLAPILLAVLRILQGMALGGEWCGATLLTVETAPSGHRARAAVWAQLGSPLGFLIANAVFLLILSALDITSLSDPDHDIGSAFLRWGWRIPFLLSAVMVGIGLYVRVRLTETPVFAEALERGESVRAPVVEVFRRYWKTLLVGSFLMVASYAMFYIVVAWAMSFFTTPGSATGQHAHYTYLEFCKRQMVAATLYAVMIPVGGRLADRLGRRPTLIGILAAVIAFGVSFPVLLGPNSPALLFLCIGMALTGLAAGAMGPVLPELFPTPVRYTGTGIAYSTASILGAAVAPFISLWLSSRFGVGAVGGYLAATAIVSMTAVALMPETRPVALGLVGVRGADR